MRRAVALASLVVALLAGGRIDAVSAATTAPPLSPDLRDRFTAGLRSLRSGGADEAAREFADPVWGTTPLQDYASLFLAQSLQRTGDAAGARAAAARAIDAAPEGRPTPPALRDAAMVLSSAGDDAGAAALYRRFLDRHADHAEAPRIRLALARSLLAAGRVPEASRALTELWLLAPASPQADDASRQLRVLNERGLGGPAPSVKERIERAERLLNAGALEPAKTEAEAVLGTRPSPDLTARALKVVADAARRAGKWDVAAQTVNRALAEMPGDRRAPWLLDLARLEQRRSRDQALATLDKLIREYPKSPEEAEALGMKARLLESAGRLADAEATYQRLAGDHPEQEEGGAALWRLGWLAWFKGAFADAAGRWNRLLTARGGQAHREAATYWIGRAYEQRGDGEQAARQYAQVLSDGPRSYYGGLAVRRGAPVGPPRAAATLVALPGDPREPLVADARFARVEALRQVGLGEFADEEMDDLTRRSLGEPRRLYALSSVYAEEARYHLALRILRRHFQPFARSGLATLPRAFWELFYPMGYRTELMEAAGRAAVDPLLVAAVVREESSFHPQARSRVGARGLMQLMPDTARPMARARRLPFNNGDLLDDPAANLDMGAAFLAGLLREFGDARLAAAAYNAGPARVRDWWAARRSDDLEVFVEQIPFNETRAFVKRVMLSWDEYRRLYGAATGVGPALASTSAWP